MRTIKKTMAALLAMVMMLSVMAVPASADESAGGYSDVAAESWYAGSVDRWTEAGIVYGYEDNTFGPDRMITRAEAVAMIARMLGLTYEEGVASFTDIDVNDPDQSWYAQKILACAAAGIVHGYEDGSFAPNKNITRQEVFKIAADALGLSAIVTPASLADFPDGTEVADWAQTAAGLVVAAGAVVGREEADGNYLRPEAEITRAEVVKILDKLVGLYVDKDNAFSLASQGDRAGNVVVVNGTVENQWNVSYENGVVTVGITTLTIKSSYPTEVTVEETVTPAAGDKVAVVGDGQVQVIGAGSEDDKTCHSRYTISLEDHMDAYWEADPMKNGAGYTNGTEGMGAVVLAVKDGEVVFEKAYGWAHYYDADYEAEGSTYANPVYVKTENPREMTTDKLFDLASVTKVMATTQSIMLLVDRGQISVEDTVATYLPGFEANGKGNITIAQLLTHSSGLPQWEATFLYCDTKEEQLEYIKGLELVEGYRTDGGEPKYSDFSFMTLGFIVEAVTGQDMDVFVKENVYEPLGMTSTTYNPLQHGFTKDQIAATSLGNPYEYRMVDEVNYPGVGYDCNKDAEAFAAFDGWRNYTLIGEVNDGNAGMGGQGVAGHAGLFSTASDLAKLLQCMLDGGKYIDANGVEQQLYSAETVELFTTKHTCYAENHNGALSEEFGYGFKLDQSWMGKSATENVFGHDGFTGTTVFADPDNDYIFICLTNKMQAGFRTPTSNSYYNTNSWASWNWNQIVKDHLGI